MARWAVGSRTLVEPFAGGGSVALRCVLGGVVERDAGVAALWRLVMGRADAGFYRMCDFITGQVQPTRAWFTAFAARMEQDSPDWVRGGMALVRNRFSWGGVMHPAAGLTSDAGLAARWCPGTMVRRMRRIRQERARFSVVEGDGILAIREHAEDEGAFFFVDPPYSHGATAPGDRLYQHSELDHDALLAAVAGVRGRAVVTYDLTADTLALAERHGLPTRVLPMRDGRHCRREELMLTKDMPGEP